MKIVPLPVPDLSFERSWHPVPVHLFHDGSNYGFLLQGDVYICGQGLIQQEPGWQYSVSYWPKSILRSRSNEKIEVLCRGRWQNFHPSLGSHPSSNRICDYDRSFLLYGTDVQFEIAAALPLRFVTTTEVGLYNKRTGECTVFDVGEQVSHVALGLDNMTFGVIAGPTKHLPSSLYVFDMEE